jgi:predicted transcriptional regulator of viral defense system
MNLFHWQQSGFIIKLRNEWYCFTDNNTVESFLFSISNKIYQPSYISLETALSFYGVIPEGVFIIQGISTLKTNQFHNTQGNFRYKHIKTKLFFGYQIIKFGQFTIKIADLEKTILDSLYYNTQLETIQDFYDLRWNKNSLKEKLNKDKLNDYVNQINSKIISRKVKILLQYIDD